MLGNQTSRSNGLSVSIDWIAFTSSTISTMEEMVEFLGYSLADFNLMPKGAHGYKHMHRLNDVSHPVSILSEGMEGMGIHVTISGSAIADVLEHFKHTITSESPFDKDPVVGLSDFDNTIMIEFLQQIRKYGWITRLDLAIDDRGKTYFSLDDIRNYLDAQEVVSKFRTFRDVYESKLTGECTGRTLYLGSRQSEIMLRIYDKQLEQNKKALDAADRIEDSWVRWEFELKNDRANIAADMLIQQKEMGEVVMSILNNYIRIIIPDDSNRSRCSAHPLWEKFVGAVGKLRLFIPQFAKTLLDKKRWLIRQCLPTIAGVIIAENGSFDIITDYFESSVTRMNTHLQRLVEKENPGWKSIWHELCAGSASV